MPATHQCVVKAKPMVSSCRGRNATPTRASSQYTSATLAAPRTEHIRFDPSSPTPIACVSATKGRITTAGTGGNGEYCAPLPSLTGTSSSHGRSTAIEIRPCRNASASGTKESLLTSKDR